MNKTFAIFCAILSAVLYSLSIPVSKLLLVEIPSTLLAGFLYIGAGIGMSFLYAFKKLLFKNNNERKITKNDFKYVFGMIILDIAAPIFLLLALSKANAESVSLLSNFEVVTTSLIAVVVFKETISKKLWVGICLITISSILLSLDFSAGVSFSWYSLFALLACLCWGLENNCTRAISTKSPYQIVIIKGIYSGIGSIIIGLCIGQRLDNWLYTVYALLLGFFSYGLSVFFYIIAQKYLGASKTSSIQALSPFIGCALSFAIFQEIPYFTFYIALTIMFSGLILVILDKNYNYDKNKLDRDNANDNCNSTIT